VKKNLLDRVDLDAKLAEKKYDALLVKWQTRLRELARELRRSGRSFVAAFEGWDAAGKGGAIRRFTQPLDPRAYEVHSIAAPEGEEKVRHYLWRFWKRLPEQGNIGVFDRTWYGRVLVERVEGFAKEHEWKRAFQEIREFEQQLVDNDVILAKFWLHLSKEEQLRRFEARKNDVLRSWKLTDEDWRNREKWPRYEVAVREMLDKTHTKQAPWTVVAGDDKLTARIQVLETVARAMERGVREAGGKNGKGKKNKSKKEKQK
jgi:AMP-polyphosphate phosphotransferase